MCIRDRDVVITLTHDARLTLYQPQTGKDHHSDLTQTIHRSSCAPAISGVSDNDSVACLTPLMYARINQSKALRSIRDSSPNYTPCNVAVVAVSLILSSSSSSFYLPRENDKYNNKGNVHGMTTRQPKLHSQLPQLNKLRLLTC